ncbi:MAG: hypothetical protein U0790_26635 [Isosphaeraceae bacterium]
MGLAFALAGRRSRGASARPPDLGRRRRGPAPRHGRRGDPPLIVIPLASRAEDLSGADLGRSMLIHAAMWVALSAVAGLAMGIGAGGRRRALDGLIGGALGALIGVIAYDLIGGLGFPLANTGMPISTTPSTRLLARLLIALGAAAGAASLLTSDRAAARRA